MRCCDVTVIPIEEGKYKIVSKSQHPYWIKDKGVIKQLCCGDSLIVSSDAILSNRSCFCPADSTSIKKLPGFNTPFPVQPVPGGGDPGGGGGDPGGGGGDPGGGGGDPGGGGGGEDPPPCPEVNTFLREELFPLYRKYYLADGNCGEIVKYLHLLPSNQECEQLNTLLSQECKGTTLHQHYADGLCGETEITIENSLNCSNCPEFTFHTSVFNVNRNHVLNKQVTGTVVDVFVIQRENMYGREDLPGRVCCGSNWVNCTSTLVGAKLLSWSQSGTTLTYNVWVECFSNSLKGCGCGGGAYTQFSVKVLCTCSPEEGT